VTCRSRRKFAIIELRLLALDQLKLVERESKPFGCHEPYTILFLMISATMISVQTAIVISNRLPI